MSGSQQGQHPRRKNSSAPPPARCAPSPKCPTCRWPSSPARPASPASAPACRCRRARCRPRRWRACAAPSDAIALRLRHHDDAVHAARMPARREAKDVYDALEQVRVEVVGSRHMAGVAANLRVQAGRGVRGRRLRPHDPQGPAADAGGAVPAGARADVRREVAAGGAARPRPVARHAGRDGRRRAGRDDRRAGRPGAPTPAPPASCWPRSTWPRPRVEAEPEDQTEEGEEGGEQSGQQDKSAGRRRPERGRAGQHAGRPARGDGRRGGRRRRHRSPRRKPPRPRATTGPAARSRAASGRNPDNDAVYRAYTRLFDEEIDAEELCDPDELTRLRQQLDQQLQHLQGVDLQAGQPAAAPAAGAADSAPGSSTSRKGCWTPAACRAWWSTRCRRCPTSASSTPISATPW